MTPSSLRSSASWRAAAIAVVGASPWVATYRPKRSAFARSIEAAELSWIEDDTKSA